MNFNENNQESEKIISEILKYIDEGKSAPQILDLLKDQKQDVSETLQALSFLYAQKNNITAPKSELLKQILKKLPDVTKNPVMSYNSVDTKGRPFISLINNQIQEIMSWKIVGSLVVVLFIGVFAYTQFASVPQNTGDKNTGAETNQQVVAEEPSVSVDSVVAAIYQDTNTESSALKVESDDLYASVDSELISDLGQSTTEYEY